MYAILILVFFHLLFGVCVCVKKSQNPPFQKKMATPINSNILQKKNYRQITKNQLILDLESGLINKSLKAMGRGNRGHIHVQTAEEKWIMEASTGI